MRTLVIGVGNPLAGDDGAGPAVAERLGDTPDVTVRMSHQLTPELAGDVAAADRVVFVDAARGGRLTVSRVSGAADGPDASPLTHVIAAETILALSRRLYGRMPAAYLVRVPGTDFRPGTDLSASVRRLIPRAVAAVKRLLIPATRTP